MGEREEITKNSANNLIWFIHQVNNGKDRLLFHLIRGEEFMVTGVEKHFNQYQGKLNTVIDIGAHIGELSILAAQRGAKHIWAIEPDIDNFKLLDTNIIMNDYMLDIIPFRLAIATHNGEIILKKPKGGGNTGQRSTLYSEGNIPAFGERVSGITLEVLLGLFLRHYKEIDYLKMDIEGAEHGVIMQTPKEVLRHIVWLDLDVHDLNNREYFSGGNDPKAVVDYLSSCGFEIISKEGDEKAFHMMLRRI